MTNPPREPLTDEQIIAIRDEFLPSQGEAFDSIAYARAILAAGAARPQQREGMKYDLDAAGYVTKDGEQLSLDDVEQMQRELDALLALEAAVLRGDSTDYAKACDRLRAVRAAR